MEDSNIKTYCVYKHTSPSGKSYIGITSKNPPEKRWANGRGYSHNKHFTNAINKYGWDNFTHEIIKDGLTEEEAQKLERELIEKYHTFDSNDGYNGTSGGEVGKQHTEENRRKQSELAKRQWQDEEFRKNQIAFKKTLVGEKNPNYGNHKLAGENHPNYGKKLKPETVEKIREKSSNISDETRKKMSDVAKARMTPEMIERIREFHTGLKPNDETRKKMSESQKARWDNESRKEWGEKFSGENNGMFGKHHSEKTKQLLREKLSGENSPWYGRRYTEEEKQKAHDASTLKIPVVQLTLQGDFIQEFDSHASAAKSVNGTPSSIIGCCNGDYKSAYGFIWVKKEKYNCDNVPVYKNNVYRPVVQLSKDWEYIAQYKNLADAARAIKGHSQNIGRCCRAEGVYMSKGFRWMYEGDYIKLKNEKE